MKKLILFGLIFASVTLISCKKEYTCECKKIYDGVNNYSQDGIYTINDTRTKAESECNRKENPGTDETAGKYSRECEITNDNY
jgi:hypothetical protein